MKKPSFIDFFRSAFYRRRHKSKIFPYYGFRVYFGKYGSGKTLSCVFDAITILNNNPDVVFVTNTAVKRY